MKHNSKANQQGTNLLDVAHVGASLLFISPLAWIIYKVINAIVKVFMK